MRKKSTWPQTICPQDDEEENKTKSKMFVLHGHIFSQTTPWADTRGTATNSMVDCQTLRHFVYRSKLQFLVSSRNQFQDGSQCDYPCRLSLKKLKVFMIREKNQRDEEKKDKVIFENSILQFNFLQLLSCFLFQKGVFQGSIKFSTHPDGSHLGV